MEAEKMAKILINTVAVLTTVKKKTVLILRMHTILSIG